MYIFSFISPGEWAPDTPCSCICFFKYLGYFYTPGFLWLSSVLQVSPPDCERTSFFVVSPTPSQVHVSVCQFLSLPSIWLIESFLLTGTMQRIEMSHWESISLDHFSWGCATSWILRTLQWSSSKTRLLSSDCLPCQCDFLVLRIRCC